MQINLLVAPVGAGKSHVSTESINENNYLSYVVATQTNAVSDELAERLVNSVVIRPTEKKASAWSQLNEQINDEHSVLICNQQVAFRQFGKSVNRHLFMDEIPEIHERIQTTKLTGYAKKLIPVLFDAQDNINDDFIRLFPTPELLEIAAGGLGYFRGKDADQLERLAERICSPHYVSYVVGLEWRFLLAGVDQALTFHIVMQPSILKQWEGASIAGANADNSLMKLVWSQNSDIKFVRDPLTDKLQYRDLSHKANLVNLFYISERSASKALFNHEDIGGKERLFRAVRDAVSRKYDGNVPEHIVCFNNDFKDASKVWNLPTAFIISPDSRGINTYKDKTLAICLAALNDTPDTVWFFRSVYGIDARTLAVARTYERYSQFFGRTAIRDFQSTASVDLICFDKDTAMFMQSQIPGANEPVRIELESTDGLTSKVAKTKIKDMTPDQRKAYDNIRQKKSRAKRNPAATGEQVAQIQAIG
jgi:hypothetical protein